MSTNGGNFEPGVMKRLAITIGYIVWVGLPVAVVFLPLRQSFGTDLNYDGAIDHDILGYWLKPGVIALGCGAIFFLITWLVAWGIKSAISHILYGPAKPEYFCKVGNACPCVDHQRRLQDEADIDNAILLASIATTAATTATIANL